MTGPDHFRQAETLAQRAEGLLHAGDPEGLASVWAAIGQVHATLALAAGRRAGMARRSSHQAQRRRNGGRAAPLGSPGRAKPPGTTD